MASVGNFVSANNPGGGGSNHNLTYASNVTPHSILVAIARCGTATTLTGMQDSPNAQVFTVGTHRDQTGRTYIAYFINNAVATTPTVTFIFSGGTAARVALFEIIPDDLTGSNTGFDRYGQTTGVDGNSAASGTSLDGGTTSVRAHNNEVVVGVFSAGADQTFSASGSYSIAGQGNRLCAVYKVTTTTAAEQAVVADSVSSEWIGITGAFQIAADSSPSAHAGPPSIRQVRFFPRRRVI